VIPNHLGIFGSVNECKDAAIKGNFDTFGVQYGGYCFAANKPAYDRLGKREGCPELGGSWTNQVYSNVDQIV